jgi:hypothetical protein
MLNTEFPALAKDKGVGFFPPRSTTVRVGGGPIRDLLAHKKAVNEKESATISNNNNSMATSKPAAAKSPFTTSKLIVDDIVDSDDEWIEAGSVKAKKKASRAAKKGKRGVSVDGSSGSNNGSSASGSSNKTMSSSKQSNGSNNKAKTGKNTADGSTGSVNSSSVSGSSSAQNATGKYNNNKNKKQNKNNSTNNSKITKEQQAQKKLQLKLKKDKEEKAKKMAQSFRTTGLSILNGRSSTGGPVPAGLPINTGGRGGRGAGRGGGGRIAGAGRGRGGEFESPKFVGEINASPVSASTGAKTAAVTTQSRQGIVPFSFTNVREQQRLQEKSKATVNQVVVDESSLSSPPRIQEAKRNKTNHNPDQSVVESIFTAPAETPDAQTPPALGDEFHNTMHIDNKKKRSIISEVLAASPQKDMSPSLLGTAVHFLEATSNTGLGVGPELSREDLDDSAPLTMAEVVEKSRQG